MSEELLPEFRNRIDLDTTLPHLVRSKSDRGFTRLPAIPSAYGGESRVYESSTADYPHIWLAAKSPKDLNNPDTSEMNETVMHFRIEDAVALAEQLLLLARDHYHHSYYDYGDDTTTPSE
jgi:hypothetical protein